MSSDIKPKPVSRLTQKLATVKVIHFNRITNLMKNSMLFFLLLMPFISYSQINETFSDGDFTQEPTWTGSSNNFIINHYNQLQSFATSASTSYLYTSSQAMNDATWEFQLMFDYPTSSLNYASVYVVSDRQSMENGLNGYFVQVGGTNDEVSLFLQQGTLKTKIIDGVDKRTDLKSLSITIKVTRDSASVFNLYSKLAAEDDFVLEGTVQNSKVKQCNYFGLSYTNTSTTGKCYLFDNITVSGTKVLDELNPAWLSLGVETAYTFRCVFSEAMNFDSLKVIINHSPVRLMDQQINNDRTEAVLTTDVSFEIGHVYYVQLEGLTDLSHNALTDNIKLYAAVEKINQGDIIFNEIMFHQPDSSFEYIELYNRSDKLIGLSGLIYTTRKADGTFNTGNKIPEGVFVAPKSCIAFTQNAEKVKEYHHCPEDAKVIQTSWTSLNNESATLVLTNALKDTVYDEFSYQVKMHHVMIKNPKGVALERIYTDLPSEDFTNWHSSAFTTNYGTPGFKNSQYRERDNSEKDSRAAFYLESKVFTPNNDGVEDVCVINYTVEQEGYMATILLLSATGERVFNLASNQLLATSGQVVWDGRNNEGKLSNIGIYVILVELFHPVYGKRKQFKIPVVLTSN